MSRDWRLYWQDVIDCCRKVEQYTTGFDRAQFEADHRTYDAVVRNLEIIGEAVKNLPQEARNLAPSIEWKRIAGMRNVLAHGYFGIDNDILWNVVSTEVTPLRVALEQIRLP